LKTGTVTGPYALPQANSKKLGLGDLGGSGMHFTADPRAGRHALFSRWLSYFG